MKTGPGTDHSQPERCPGSQWMLGHASHYSRCIHGCVVQRGKRKGGCGSDGPAGWIIGNEGDFLSGIPWIGFHVMVHCHAHCMGVMVGNRDNIMIGTSMVRFRVH